MTSICRVDERNVKEQTNIDQITMSASDSIGGAMGSVAFKLACQGGELTGQDLKEVACDTLKGVAVNATLNITGDVVRGGLENVIPADKIPCIGSVVRVYAVGQAIFTAPNKTEAVKRGTNAVANCAIQYGAGAIAPAIVTGVVGAPIFATGFLFVGVVAGTAVVGASVGIAIKDAFINLF